jgi:phosphoenolpyruvate carboxylase
LSGWRKPPKREADAPLRRWRETGAEEVKRPVLHSIAGIAAALRNTG